MNETLYQLIRSCWTSDGNFSLGAAQLTASPARTVLAKHFPGETLLLTGATMPVLENGFVVIQEATCVSKLLQFNSAKVTARFYVDATNNTHFDLTTTDQALTFRFNESFPAIKDHANWGGLTLTQAKLRLDSILLANTVCRDLERMYAPKRFPETSESRVVKGWKISGLPGLPEGWSWIYDLLGNRSRFRIEGPLEILDGKPRFLLATPMYEPVAIGHLRPAFAFEMIGWLAEYGLPEGEITLSNFSYRFRAQLTPPIGTQPLTLFAKWGLSTPDQLQFTIDAQLNLDGAIQTLDSFFNLPPEQGLRTLIPTQNFPAVNTIKLKTIDFNISLSPFRLHRLTASLGMDENASQIIFPQLVTAKQFELVADLWPGTAGSPRMKLNASCGIVLHTMSQPIRLNTRIDLPSLNYSIGLDPVQTFNISGFVHSLFPSLGNLPAVWCDTLSCTGKIYPPELLFESAFESDIELDWLSLNIRSFGLSFSARRIGDENIIDAEAFVAATLAGQFDVILHGSISRDQLNVSGTISTSEKLRLPQILPAGIRLPDYFNTWEFEKGSLEVQRGTTNRVKFSLQGNVMLDFGSIGNIAATSLDVTIQKEEGKDWSVKIESSGSIKVFAITDQGPTSWLIDLAGKVTINASSLLNWSMVFTANDGSGRIGPVPLPVPKRIDGINVTPSNVTVYPKSVSISMENGNWKFDTKSIFKLDTFAFLQNLIPEAGTEAHLIIQKLEGVYSASLELRNLIGFTIPINIPERQRMPAISLGNTRFELTKASIAISNRLGLTFSAETSWFLPEYMNELFGIVGRPEDHNPKFRFFKTYKPAGQVPTDALTLKFQLGLGTNGQPSGSVTLNALPINLIQPDGDKFVLSFGPATDPGKYGKIKFAKPILAYNAVKGFEMELDFEIEKDPAIPLKPLIDLLKNAKLDAIANLLPDPLPIPISDPPRFFENGAFNWTLLEALVKKCWPNDTELFPKMKALLEPIAHRFEQLPDTLKTYLQPPGIRGLKFKLTASPTGNVELGFEMKQDPGVKPEDPSEMKRSAQILLIPGLPLVFFGLRLRKFHFGELFGGQLFTTLIDADIDVFDMPSLIASLVDNPDVKYYVGDSKKFKRTIQLYDLRTFIVWQTQMPIFIPAFYRHVGIDYYGLGDVRFQSGFGFPEPEFDLVKLGEIIKDLVTFARDPAAPMPENADYRPMDLAFKMGPLYLETGAWMGKKVIGWKTPLTPPGGITLSSLLAKVLNTIKFFSVNKFIASIPFENRHAEGALASEFLGMSLGGKFLLSTPYEFVNTEAGRWNLLPEQTTQLMSVLPTGVTKDTPGVVLFLRGEWTSTFGSLHTSFGLIAIDSKRFAIGFRFDGTLASSIQINSNAFVTINPPETPFAFSGTSNAVLKYAGMEFFNGFITASGNHRRFDFSGQLKLTEPGQTFNINGNAAVAGHFDQNSFSISGGANVSFLIFQGSGSFKVEGVSTVLAKGTLKLNIPGILVLDSTFDLSPTQFTLSTSSNLFNVFPTTIEAVMNKPTQTIAFKLESQPLNNLFGFYLSFNARFGSNSGQTGTFKIKLVGQELVSGDCELQDANMFKIRGTLTLGLLNFSVSGTFSSSGFSIEGSTSFASIASIGVNITNQGITFWVEAFGLPRSNTALKSCNDTLYLCSSTGNAKFYIDLKNALNSRAKDCPCGLKRFVPCPYPEKAENFLYVTYLVNDLFTAKKQGKGILSRSHNNHKHHSTVRVVNAAQKSFSIEVRRHGHHKDIFSEMLDFMEDRLGSHFAFLIARYIGNVNGAAIVVRETTIHQMHKGQVTIVVSFPSAIEHFQRIETTLSFANPRHASDLIADEMMRYFYENEWPDQQKLLRKVRKKIAVKEVTVLKANTKKTIALKRVAKKVTTKKAASKKPAERKPVAKKVIVKKTDSQKPAGTGRKTGSKKAAGKKTIAKKQKRRKNS